MIKKVAITPVAMMPVSSIRIHVVNLPGRFIFVSCLLWKMLMRQSYSLILQGESIEYGLCFRILQNFNAMLINELSKRSGVTVHTLRYYENIGLIM
jgi:hypothetical protein